MLEEVICSDDLRSSAFCAIKALMALHSALDAARFVQISINLSSSVSARPSWSSGSDPVIFGAVSCSE